MVSKEPLSVPVEDKSCVGIPQALGDGTKKAGPLLGIVARIKGRIKRQDAGGSPDRPHLSLPLSLYGSDLDLMVCNRVGVRV